MTNMTLETRPLHPTLAREVLGLPDDKFCAYMISLGYPADRPLSLIRRPDRRPFDEVVHREHW